MIGISGQQPISTDQQENNLITKEFQEEDEILCLPDLEDCENRRELAINV